MDTDTGIERRYLAASSDLEDDLELLRRIHDKHPEVPICIPAHLDQGDDEDDFEMLHRIQNLLGEEEGEHMHENDRFNVDAEQYDDRGKDKANSDEKSQKTKKRESEKHYELDEDDYELLSDNNVKGFRRQKSSKTFKRLKKAQRDTEGEHSLFSGEEEFIVSCKSREGPSLEDIAEEDEQTEEEDDEMADFIVYEEEEDDKIPGRRKNLKKCRRQQEFCAIFGCSTLHQRERDNSTECSKKLKIENVLEPIVLSRKYMTVKDNLIRARDIPERQQISEEASGTPPTDEMSIYDECNWIFNQLETGMSATGERELVIEKERIQEFINLIRFQKLDIPFIATRWKLKYPSLFEVPDQHEVDSDYPSKADQKRGLTRHMVVWDIHKLDTEWLLLQLRKSALQSNKRFKEESCRVHDETYRTSTDQLFESITKSLKDAESEREVKDVELKYYLHFPEVGVGQGKCKRLPNRGTKYKVCREAGLGAVADKFGFRLGQFGLQDELKYPKEAPEAVAFDFISTGFETSQAVLEGARHMAAVQICCEPCVRKNVRSIFMDKAVVSTCPTSKDHAAIDTFHQFSGVKWLRDKPLTRFKDAQWLLIQKAEEQKLLQVTVKLPDSVSDKLIADSSFYYLSDGAQLWNEQRKMIVQAAFVHFLLPSMEKEARSLLACRAKKWLCNENEKRLWDVVSVAPYKRKQNSEDAALKVMACCWWPGERATTFVMLNSFGELVDTLDAMYFSVSSQNSDDWQRKMNDVQRIGKFMTDHKPHVIVLGGVNLSCKWIKKDIDRIISLAVSDNPQVDIIYGDADLPRLYENSRISVDQLPGYSGSVKRAVALGRVQLNPLAMFASLCGHDRDILFWKRSPLDSFLTDDEKYGMVEQVMVDVTSQVGLDVKVVDRPL